MTLPARPCLRLPRIVGGVFCSLSTKSIKHSNMAMQNTCSWLASVGYPFSVSARSVFARRIAQQQHAPDPAQRFWLVAWTAAGG